jgi:hypothetical protein
MFLFSCPGGVFLTTYKLIPELNGIELYFEDKPSVSICEELKNNGWRWHYTKRCWYTRMSEPAEALAKKLCKSGCNSELMYELVPVSISQFFCGQYVSTLTITPERGELGVASTNNLILCNDCKSFFSIHASACPFCGCPIKHTVEQTYYYYHPNAVREREKQKETESLRYKSEQIQELRDYCIVSRNFERLLELDDEAFETAKRRAEELDDIAEEIDELSEWLWWKLLTIGEAEYKMRINYLKEAPERERIRQKADEAQRKLEMLKMEARFQKSGVSNTTLERLVDQGITCEEVQTRVDIINYYAKEYPGMELDVNVHIFYPSDYLKKQIQRMIACGKVDGEVYLCDTLEKIDYLEAPF